MNISFNTPQTKIIRDPISGIKLILNTNDKGGRMYQIFGGLAPPK